LKSDEMMNKETDSFHFLQETWTCHQIDKTHNINACAVGSIQLLPNELAFSSSMEAHCKGHLLSIEVDVHQIRSNQNRC